MKAATLHKGSVVKRGITDNSIRSLSFRATHHIFCMEFFGEGGASSNTMGNLEAPEQAKAEIWATENSSLSNSSF